MKIRNVRDRDESSHEYDVELKSDVDKMEKRGTVDRGVVMLVILLSY